MISISIIIPVYQVEQYIQRCIDSVTNQHFTNAEIECIIVDDCGLDKSMEIVGNLLTNYQGPISFRLLRQSKNRGLSAARNFGVENAVGQYVFFIDSDDYILPGCFQYFIDNLLENPYVDMIVADAQDCKNNDRPVHNITKPRLTEDIESYIQELLRRKKEFYVWNRLIKRELLINKGVSFVEGIIFEDQPWTYLVALHLKQILFLPQITYVYSYNLSSLSNAVMTADRARTYLFSYMSIVRVMLNNPPSISTPGKNLTVDYLLFIGHIMMRGCDLLLSFNIDDVITIPFRKYRNRMFLRSLKYGRLIVTAFFILQYPPLYYLQKLKSFRLSYNGLERIVEKLAHLTDFLHRKQKW